MSDDKPQFDRQGQVMDYRSQLVITQVRRDSEPRLNTCRLCQVRVGKFAVLGPL